MDQSMMGPQGSNEKEHGIMSTIRTQQPSAAGYPPQTGPAVEQAQPSPQTQNQPETQTGDASADQQAYGSDGDATAKPKSYPMNQEWEMPAIQGPPPAPLQLVDFDDEGSSAFDPGYLALEQQVQQKQQDNFDQVAEADQKASSETRANQAQAGADDRTGVDAHGLNTDDPAIQALLSKVREADEKNFKAMIDMLQKSLDRARETMERNMKDYYQKVLPQMQAVQNQIKQVSAAEESGRKQDMQAAADRIGNLGQQLQQALNQNPDFQSNPAAKNAVAALAALQQASSKLTGS